MPHPETIIMSKSFNTTATAVATKTPYCKVCHDAGRPSSEYTSHYVKDQPGPDGKVVCPTLLNQSCRICNKTGHTSSYCVQYRSRRSEEPRREERYIEREQPRREERYIEREQPRREERGARAYNRLRDDTERHEREIRDRDDSYHREQDRRSKPWLQAALNPSSSSSSSSSSKPHERRAPYAHPHGPRVRLSLESTALSASKHAAVAIASVDQNQQQPQTAVIDVLKVDLHHAKSWVDEPFECDPELMFRQLAEECLMSSLTRDEEFDFMAACDNDNN